MPRAKNAAKQSTKPDPNVGRRYYLPNDAPWGGFVDLRIDVAERGDFDGWVHTDEDQVWEGVRQTLVDGMALSIKYDAQNSCFTASYLGKGVATDDSRYCLVARGASWHEALALVQYKHAMLMDGDWGDYKPATGRLEQFG